MDFYKSDLTDFRTPTCFTKSIV